MWVLKEGKRGRKRQRSVEQPGMFGDWRGVGCGQSPGCQEACAERGPWGTWWSLVGLAGFPAAQYGALLGFKQRSDVASSGT